MPNSNNVHEQILQSMQEMKRKFEKLGINLMLPPPSNTTLGTKYTGVDLGNSIEAEIPFDSRFCNPIGIFQGGFLCGAMDEVFGPLTYMACGRPVVTIEMSTTFLRPFTQKDEVLRLRAEVIAKTKSLISLRAEARTRDGKLVACSSNNSMILSDEQIISRT